MYSLYGGYSPQQYASNVERMSGNRLFGRPIGLLDHTPYISEPQQQSWRDSSLRNFLPGYQQANNAFYQPRVQSSPSPFGVPPDAGVAPQGDAPFQMHPTSPSRS